jgi:hypothetical protein
MAGPATNVATIGAVKRAFGGRVLAVYLATVIGGSLGLAYVYDAFLPLSAVGAGAHMHEHPWWAWISAFALAVLFLYFAFDDVRAAIRRRRVPTGGTVTFEVEGMSCGNCARKLERALEQTKGVTAANVVLDSKRVTVEGCATAAELEAAVRGAGYAVK